MDVVGYVTIKIPVVDEEGTMAVYLSRAQINANVAIEWEDLAYDLASSEIFYEKVMQGG